MNKFMEFMDKHFIPVATKIGSQRHLVAIRDAFISIMPITMVGSIAVLLNVFLRDLPNSNGMENISAFFAPVIAINGNVWFASIAILTCVFVFALGYHLAVDYKVTHESPQVLLIIDGQCIFNDSHSSIYYSEIIEKAVK